MTIFFVFVYNNRTVMCLYAKCIVLWNGKKAVRSKQSNDITSSEWVFFLLFSSFALCELCLYQWRWALAMHLFPITIIGSGAKENCSLQYDSGLEKTGFYAPKCPHIKSTQEKSTLKKTTIVKLGQKKIIEQVPSVFYFSRCFY